MPLFFERLIRLFHRKSHWCSIDANTHRLQTQALEIITPMMLSQPWIADHILRKDLKDVRARIEKRREAYLTLFEIIYNFYLLQWLHQSGHYQSLLDQLNQRGQAHDFDEYELIMWLQKWLTQQVPSYNRFITDHTPSHLLTIARTLQCEYFLVLGTDPQVTQDDELMAIADDLLELMVGDKLYN